MDSLDKKSIKDQLVKIYESPATSEEFFWFMWNENQACVIYIKSFFEVTVKSGVKKGDSFINLFQNNDPDSLIDLNEQAWRLQWCEKV